MELMYRVGVPRSVTLDILETWLYERDNLTLIPECFFEIQRLAMVLQGVGLEVGAGKVCIATMFKGHALRFLGGGVSKPELEDSHQSSARLVNGMSVLLSTVSLCTAPRRQFDSLNCSHDSVWRNVEFPRDFPGGVDDDWAKTEASVHHRSEA